MATIRIGTFNHKDVQDELLAHIWPPSKGRRKGSKNGDTPRTNTKGIKPAPRLPYPGSPKTSRIPNQRGGNRCTHMRRGDERKGYSLARRHC